MAHVGHRSAELGLALGVKAFDGLPQQDLDAVDHDGGQRGARLADTGITGAAADQPAHIAHIPQIVNCHRCGKTGQAEPGAGEQTGLEIAVVGKQPLVHSHQPRRHQRQYKRIGLDVGRQRQNRQHRPLGGVFLAQRQPRGHGPAEHKARGHIAVAGHVGGGQVDGVVVVREEERHAPQRGGHRHGHTPFLAGDSPDNGGKYRKIQNVITDVNFPICIIAQKLEEIRQQRQAGVLGRGPGGAQFCRGVQVVVDLRDFDRGGPKAQLVKISGHRLAHKKVDGERQRHAPEQHTGGGKQLLRRSSVVFAGGQHPHAARQAERIHRPGDGVEHPRHGGQRQHRHDEGQCRQRCHRRRDAAFQRKYRAAAKQRRHGSQYAEQFHRTDSFIWDDGRGVENAAPPTSVQGCRGRTCAARSFPAKAILPFG